jgi:TPR repeat protein
VFRESIFFFGVGNMRCSNSVVAGIIGVAIAVGPAARGGPVRCDAATPSACSTEAIEAWDAGDPASTRVNAEVGCAGGDAESCALLAQLDLAHPDPAAISRALDLATDACDLGAGRACYVLGDAYWVGRGVERLRIEGAVFYELGCDAGFAPACTRLGVVTAQGQGIPLQAEVAARAWSRACVELEDATGCMFHGLALSSGVGVAVDREAALAAFDRSCGAGWPEGCLHRADLRVTLARGAAGGRRVLRLACDAGDGTGCWLLAHHTDDLEAASALVERACAAGLIAACPAPEAVPAPAGPGSPPPAPPLAPAGNGPAQGGG